MIAVRPQVSLIREDASFFSEVADPRSELRVNYFIRVRNNMCITFK